MAAAPSSSIQAAVNRSCSADACVARAKIVLSLAGGQLATGSPFGDAPEAEDEVAQGSLSIVGTHEQQRILLD